jgi:hypothetical protein
VVKVAIEFSGPNLFGHVEASAVPDGDLDAGVAVVERGQGTFDHGRALAGAADHAQSQLPCEDAAQRGQLAARSVDLGEGLAGSAGTTPPCRWPRSLPAAPSPPC